MSEILPAIVGKQCGACERLFEVGDRHSRGLCGRCYQRFQRDNPHLFKGNVGVCPTCGKGFKSKSAKQFCSLVCYVASPIFKKQAAAQQKKMVERKRLRFGYADPTQKYVVCCKNCGKVVETRKSRPKQYCSSICRREYFAKRFDRWIASPEEIALPQNYDEFLCKDTLPCLMEGCEWEGRALSAHMNFAHGVTAAEFKEMAGFNDTTGVVCRETHVKMSQRMQQWRTRPGASHMDANLTGSRLGMVAKPRRLEGKEHAKKSMAEMLSRKPGRTLNCRQCGTTIEQPIIGHRLYCNDKCRSKFYIERQPQHDLRCTYCGEKFKGSNSQARRHKAYLPVVCCIQHRQLLNASRKTSIPATPQPHPSTSSHHQH